MNFQMNKKTIIAIAILVIVCCGSILGVKMMTDSIEPQTTAPTITQQLPTVPPTTAPTTTAPTTTAPTTAPTTVAPTTTTSPPLTLPTTAPTTMPTTLPTTTAPITMPSLQIPTTSKDPQTNINNAALFDKGFLSYQFNPDGNFYYTNEDPWQRALGYTEFYDIGAPFLAIYFDTIRCKFRYEEKDWMIQFWKGQYGYVFIGAEIGVYYKPANRAQEFYDCVTDEDALYMSMTMYRDGKEALSRDYGLYWWCTGFVPGKLDNFSDRSELTVKCRITMKDYKMLLAFTGALKENGFILDEDFKTSGLDVFFTWQ